MGIPAATLVHQLDPEHALFERRLPPELAVPAREFETLWNLHPDRFHEMVMHGKPVKTPRWQQAYERDYQYSGSRNNALPLPAELAPFLSWAQEEIDPRLNGLLLNWYDGGQRHYIGKHRDSIVGLVPGAPIVTISLGDERKFRLRPWRGSGFKDFAATDGTVFILPFDTNRAWTHEVPASQRQTGRRISITLRAFADEAWPGGDLPEKWLGTAAATH